jgi:hypothetical protein
MVISDGWWAEFEHFFPREQLDQNLSCFRIRTNTSRSVDCAYFRIFWGLFRHTAKFLGLKTLKWPFMDKLLVQISSYEYHLRALNVFFHFHALLRSQKIKTCHPQNRLSLFVHNCTTCKFGCVWIASTNFTAVRQCARLVHATCGA